ncbi:hypothetical protein L1887_48050 [Cichorium endivia]|nr:hypothetical protein L1887_48050 [Cichorium endivia]
MPWLIRSSFPSSLSRQVKRQVSASAKGWRKPLRAHRRSPAQDVQPGPFQQPLTTCIRISHHLRTSSAQAKALPDPLRAVPRRQRRARTVSQSSNPAMRSPSCPGAPSGRQHRTQRSAVRGVSSQAPLPARAQALGVRVCCGHR